MAATRALLDAASTASADWLVRTSWQAAVLIVAVVAIQWLIGHKRLPPKWAYALWMLVAVRLLMPAVPQSPWSVFNLSVPTSWGRAVENARTSASSERPAAEAATPRNLPTRLPEGTRVTVGIIDGAERRATSSEIVTPTDVSRREIDAAVAPTFAIDWKRIVVFAWMSGAAIALLRVLVALLILRRRIRTGTSADANALALLEECRREMGLGTRRPPRLVVTDAVSGPALLGFFRPVLLVPPTLITELSRDELRFVFLHELAHLRRRDPLANVLLVLATAVHWFNPMVRFALARCRAERELACDELVMSCVDRSPAATTSAPASAYGHAVLRVALSLRPSARRVPVAAVAMIHTGSQLRRRIAMIANYTPAKPGRRSSRLPRVVMPTLLLLLVASCALTDGATKPPASTTRPAPVAGSKEPAVTAEAGAREVSKSEASAANDDTSTDGPGALYGVLNHTIPELQFDGVPFTDVIDFLREKSGNANISVDWRSLEAAGIDRNTPVSTRLRNVRFERALQIVLDNVGGDNVKLGYTADENILKIATADALAKNTVTKVYDIRDIIIEVPDYASPKNAPTPPQTRPDPAKQREALITEVTDLIKETVDPDSWRDSGGSVGSLRELQGQLIITQTPENHRSVAMLLSQLRETRAMQITVETRFLTIDPNAVDEALRKKLLPSVDRQGQPATSFLYDEDVQAILRASQKQQESTTVTAPRLTLFNGQRAYVMVATQRAYVSGFSATKQGDGKAKWEPIISSAEAGVTLDVAATCSADRKFATLTLRPELTQLVAMRDEPFRGSADAPSDLFVQVPQITAQRLQTTVNVPDRQTLLLGGLVADVDATGQPTTRPTGNLYMLVKPTLIEQRAIPAK